MKKDKTLSQQDINNLQSKDRLNTNSRLSLNDEDAAINRTASQKTLGSKAQSQLSLRKDESKAKLSEKQEELKTKVDDTKDKIDEKADEVEGKLEQKKSEVSLKKDESKTKLSNKPSVTNILG